jgi:hypothetical protein
VRQTERRSRGEWCRREWRDVCRYPPEVHPAEWPPSAALSTHHPGPEVRVGLIRHVLAARRSSKTLVRAPGGVSAPPLRLGMVSRDAALGTSPPIADGARPEPSRVAACATLKLRNRLSGLIAQFTQAGSDRREVVRNPARPVFLAHPLSPSSVADRWRSDAAVDSSVMDGSTDGRRSRPGLPDYVRSITKETFAVTR